MRAAIERRDPAYDGRFHFGVVTTGIYCRPSCRSRAPKPENLRFFSSTEAAETAGFRPCKRCRPKLASDGASRALFELARAMMKSDRETMTLASLGRKAHMSPGHLQRRFKALFGLSPREFQEATRLGRLRQLLRDNARPDVLNALLDAGFGSASQGYRVAERQLGMTPQQFRAGAPNELIWFASKSCSLGRLMLGATARGVCFVQFGDSAEALEATLRSEFPRAQFAAANGRVRGWLTTLARRIDRGSHETGEIPLDLRGTAFQMRVWRELQRIQSGTTRSYRQIATRIGVPDAVRAVASACARNRVAVLVPCHRVIRGDGNLAGYRWGLQRKRDLLAAEAATTTSAGASRRYRR